ncbi:hypothetical protein TNCV_2152921 [Trichonephila clavipes]|nr:hypothetical protein TNCV_2152921 [Trichonephila clavipes]
MFHAMKIILGGRIACKRIPSLRTKALCNQYLSNNFSTTQPAFADPKEPKRGKTPIGKLDQQVSQLPEEDLQGPYAPFPDNTNPVTGEVLGPRGPEPTRYGDWERKGRVSDF